MHERAVGFYRLLGVDRVRCRLVIDFDQFRGVFGDGARVGHHCCDPLAGIANDVVCQRIARYFGRIYADRERPGGGAEFFAGQHIMHARHRQRGFSPDREYPRARIRRSDQSDVLHSRQRDIGHKAAAAHHETRVLLSTALLPDVAELLNHNERP